MGQNRKKLPCPKIRIFDYPAVIDFGQNLTLRLWRQITVGTPQGPSWGQWGPIGSKKWVETVKITMPQNSNFRLPRAHRFRPKFDFTVMAPNHGGDPLGSILGPMGSQGPKKSYHANGVRPKFTVNLVKKMGRNQKITMPQNLNFRLPCAHRFRPKIRLYGYGAKSRWGPPRVHLGANGVPKIRIFGPKNGSKSTVTINNYHAPKFEFSNTPRSLISAKIRI